MIRRCSSQIAYQIEKLLGEGLNSRVYLATRFDRAGAFAQKVALKIAKSGTPDQELRREFDSLSHISSPYCVRVYGFEHVEAQQGLVLEYVEGVTLRQLALSGVLSRAHLYLICLQCRRGLLDLARQGLFHGDLSPQNIMIDVSGRVKLIDFGLSNHHQGRRLQVTPEFVSPELFKGKPANFSTDLYSLREVFKFCRKFLADQGIDERDFEDLFDSGQRDFFWNQEISAVRSVAREVQRLRREEFEVRAAKTAEISLLGRNSRFESRASRRLLLAGVLIFVFISTGHRSSSLEFSRRGGQLHVRTQKWRALRINGRDYGYTPLTLNLPEGEALLEWREKGREKRRTVFLRPGRHLILEESFFNPSSFNPSP